MSGLKTLFSGPKIPKVEEPAEMPDEQDIAAKRKRRGNAATNANRVAATSGSVGGEYTRGTLG